MLETPKRILEPKEETEQYVEKVALRLVRYLKVSEELEQKDYAQLGGDINRINIGLPKLSQLENQFWVDQIVLSFDDMAEYSGDNYRDYYDKLKDKPPSQNLSLIHFFPTQAEINEHDFLLSLFSKEQDEYRKNLVKLYFVLCLYRFIECLETGSKNTSENFEIWTNEQFINYLSSLGFTRKPDIYHSFNVRQSVTISRLELLALKPKLMDNAKKYLKIRLWGKTDEAMGKNYREVFPLKSDLQRVIDSYIREIRKYG